MRSSNNSKKENQSSKPQKVRLRLRHKEEGSVFTENYNFLRFLDTGHLSPGIHAVSLESLKFLVCFNPHRAHMWSRLCDFLTWAGVSRHFRFAYLGGTFVSDKQDPHDVDLILETASPYGSKAFEVIAPFFSFGLDRIYEVYGVHLHFWIDGSPSAFCDYRIFFQYNRPQATFAPEQVNGIVRLDLDQCWEALKPFKGVNPKRHA